MTLRKARASSVSIVVLTTLVVLAGDSALAQGEMQPRLAVLPITGDGVLVDDLGPIEEALRREVTRLQRYRVVDRARTLAELRSARSLGLHCAPFELSCLVRLGLVGEMDLIIAPAATREGRFVAVTLSLVDVTLEREVSRVARVVDPRAMEESAGRLVGELLDDRAGFGMLAISATPDGAAIVVDGVERGRTPLRAPLGGLTAGEHELVVEKEGHRSARAVVVVRERSISRYDLRLARLEEDEPAPEAAVVELVDEETSPPAMDRPVTRARDNAPLIGASLSGAVGAAIALAGGLGAFTLFGLAEQGTLPAEQQETARLSAQALLVVAAAGALVAIGSAAFLGVELMRSENEGDNERQSPPR